MNTKNFKLIGTVVVELLWLPIWKTWFREKRDTKTLDTTHGYARRLRTRKTNSAVCSLGSLAKVASRAQSVRASNCYTLAITRP